MPPPNTAHILLISDAEQTIARLQPHLTAAGYSLQIFTINEARNDIHISYQFHEHPDVVLFDAVQAQDLSYKACQALTSSAPWSELPILMLVSHDTVEHSPEASTCGAQDLVPVSSSPSLLMAYLRGYLRGKASRDAALEQAKEMRDAAVFRTMVEHANDAIVILQDGQIVYRNPAHRKLFAFPPGTEVSYFLGRHCPGRPRASAGVL